MIFSFSAPLHLCAHPLLRHCERSEAIQSMAQLLDCRAPLRSLAMTMVDDEVYYVYNTTVYR